MASKYLLEITTSKFYLTDEYAASQWGMNNSYRAIEHRFKVHGESRLLAIVNDSSMHNMASAEYIALCSVGQLKADHTKCTPLIPYENFAKTSLGVTEDEVQKKGATPAFDPEKETYWIQVDIGYEGHTLEELRQAWHDEAVAALGLVHGGVVPIVLYKSVFMK